MWCRVPGVLVHAAYSSVHMVRCCMAAVLRSYGNLCVGGGGMTRQFLLCGAECLARWCMQHTAAYTWCGAAWLLCWAAMAICVWGAGMTRQFLQCGAECQARWCMQHTAAYTRCGAAWRLRCAAMAICLCGGGMTRQFLQCGTECPARWGMQHTAAYM